jgi:dihydropteroate synthase
MAVLNLTPDSFSDGGRLQGPPAVLAAARRALAQGADVLDLGAQSSRPGAVAVGADEECRRLLPALALLRDQLGPDPLISVDTTQEAVAVAALDAGADWINDVSGGRADPGLLPLVGRRGCPLVLMHSRGDSSTMDDLARYDDVCAEVENELLQATDTACRAGVAPDRILWDPGLGFAKTTEHNLTLLAGLPRLGRHGFPLLVGPSRKRFIGAVLQEPRPRARLWGTAASVCRAIAGGARVVRVHDVGPIVQTCRMADALWPPR